VFEKLFVCMLRYDDHRRSVQSQWGALDSVAVRVDHRAVKVMAVWQVEFALVPRRWLAGHRQVAPPEVMDTDWWNPDRLPAGYSQQIAAIAPPETSRSADLQTWGHPDGNRVDVWSRNGKPTRMTARVDVRRLDTRFGAMLLQFARVADAVLVRRDGLVVEPDVGAFGSALRTSEAWRYAADPAAYFASYAEPSDDDR